MTPKEQAMQDRLAMLYAFLANDLTDAQRAKAEGDVRDLEAEIARADAPQAPPPDAPKPEVLRPVPRTTWTALQPRAPTPQVPAPPGHTPECVCERCFNIPKPLPMALRLERYTDEWAKVNFAYRRELHYREVNIQWEATLRRMADEREKAKGQGVDIPRPTKLVEKLVAGMLDNRTGV